MSNTRGQGPTTAVASIQRQLDEHLDAIRGQRSYSEAGRKTEMAKAVLAARADVDKMLRYREKIMATTWSARQDQRIRYTQPSTSPPTSVSALDDYLQL